MNHMYEAENTEYGWRRADVPGNGAACLQGRISPETVSRINARLLFQSGRSRPRDEVRPWQYVEMEYSRMGLTSPFLYSAAGDGGGRGNLDVPG